MTQPALAVPVRLDALVIDQSVLARDRFRRWPFDYLALQEFMSPEPDQGDRNTGGAGPGIHLHWTLPLALRHGRQDSPAAAPVYPPGPSRWLVARFTGAQPRAVTAWVVESDCPFTPRAKADGYDDTQCSLYLAEPAIIRTWQASTDAYRNGVQLDPASTDPQVANIGIAFRAATWQERSATPTFLSAVAPGNPAFSSYTAHNAGVFSFHDDLAGIDNDTVSYAVIGWYADAAQDVLAAATPYQDLLAGLGWQVTGPGAKGAQPRQSVYHGMALSIPWRRDGVYPAGTAPADPLQDISAGGKLGVGIGNTTEDAFLALAGRELAAKDYPTSALPLLRAFLYDVLPLLNETGGDLLARRRITDAWFGSRLGGYRWTVTPPPVTSASPQPFQAPAWLAKLNDDQAGLDAGLAALYSLQWQFNAMWLKNGLLANGYLAPDDAPDPSLIAGQLDPATLTTVAGRLVAQLRSVLAQVGSVPQPDWTGGGTAQDSFERGIAAFVAARGGLASQAALKAITASPFRTAANPVVALAGVPVPAAEDGAGLAVRQVADLITALTVNGHAISGDQLPPVPSLASMPDVVGPLLREFFLLDPASAATLAAASGVPAAAITAAITGRAAASYTGTRPALDPGVWDRQPWQPLFFEWRVSYQSVPPGRAGPGPWVFDGDDYHLAAGTPPPPSRSVGAISLLSQQAPTLFGARLAAFVRQHGDETALAQLDTWLDAIDGWQVLSQELVGFGDLLAQRDHRAFRRPTAADQIGPASAPLSVADLAGYVDAGQASSLPDRYRGQVTTWPYLRTGMEVPFAGVRAGQMYFTEVLLYDKFGRVLQVVEQGQDAGLYQAANFPVDIDPALAVDSSLSPTIASVIQLPLRLVQGSRLDLTLLDGRTQVPVTDGNATANPIGGWILPNHLEASLLLYAADGTSLGAYRLFETADGGQSGAWEPPAHSQISTLAEVAALAPLVAGFVSAPELAAAASFTALLSAVDTTLWTVDSGGARAGQNLSLLVGRPLALVPMRITLTLDGAALTDASWKTTIDPPVPGFLSTAFPVRLGDQATRDDGLVGYFTAGNFGTLNTVVPPDPAPPQSYLRQIGPPGPPGSCGQNYPTVSPAPPAATTPASTDVVLLLDPRTAVHATTGIVPPVELRIPDRFTGSALSRLELQFHVPTAVTFRQPTPTPAGQQPPFPEAITFPLPAGQHGQWSWWQRDATGAWTGAAVLDAPPDAQFTGAPGNVADGVLQLIVDLEP